MSRPFPKPRNCFAPWAGGDQQALSALVPRVYRELRSLAGRCLRNELPGQSLQVTDLVHEAYLHLADANLRPRQFCVFLKALLGEEEMQRLMVHAIGFAKQID